MSEYVEFAVHSPGRLEQLGRVVGELQREKTSASRRAPQQLEALLDAEALAHFSRPPPAARARRLHDLETCPVVETPPEKAVVLRWDFDSMVHAIMEADYDLVSCEPSGPGKAQLRFTAHAYPYGGVGALVALVEAFGFAVTGIDDGTGFVSVAGGGR